MIDAKTLITYFMQHDLNSFLIAEMRMISGSPKYCFRLWNDNKLVWEGNLQQLTEAVLLGVTYAAILQQVAKEQLVCQTQEPSTPKTSGSEQDKPEDTKIPF